MKISSSNILATALQGMQQGQERALDAAQRVASYGSSKPGTDDLVEPMIDLKLAEHEVKANAAVIRSTREMEDSVLDILA